MIKIIKYSILFIIFSIITSLFVIYFYMLKGINISDIHYKNINIGELYIKIDKKLIFKAKNINIHINKSTKTKNISSEYKNFQKFLQYLDYFQKVKIENLNINNNKISNLSFENNILILNTKKIYISTIFKFKNQKTYFKIKKILFKKQKLTLTNINGNFTPSIFKLKLYIYTTYKKTKIEIKANLSSKNISYSGIIYNLNNKFLLNIIKQKLPNIQITKIIFNGNLKKITFQTFKNKILIKNIHILIPEIVGNFTKDIIRLKISSLNSFNSMFHIKLNNINTQININKKTIFLTMFGIFNYKTLKNIKTSKIIANINLNNFNADLKANKITQNKIIANKAHISYQNHILSITTHTNSLFSKAVTNILKTFNIPTKIHQIKGENNATLNFNYNFTKNKFNANIKIKTKNSILKIASNLFLCVKQANLMLKNNILYIKNSNINFHKSILNVDYYINKGEINFDKLFIKSDGVIKQLNIKNIFQLRYFPEKFHMNLKNLNINLANLDTNISINKNISIYLNDLSKLSSYNKYMKKFKIYGGKLKIKIANNVNINALIKTNQKIISYNKKYLKKININIQIKKNLIRIKNKNINFTIDKNLTFLKGNYKNLDINITKFLSQNNKSNLKYIQIFAKNSYIIYKNMRLYSQILKLHKIKNELNILSKYNSRTINITDQNNLMIIKGKNIKNKTFQDITNTNYIKNSNINFTIFGNGMSGLWQGDINLEGGYISSLIAVQNIMALINFVPSILSFQPVGFSNKGYKIKKGYLKFIYYDKILYVKKMTLKGLNANFSAKGYLNFKTNQIKMNVNINLLIKLINKIPIVNWILFGDNGGITMKLSVTGNIQKPTIHKNSIENILSGPLNIIKRTLLIPFKPFMKK